jgi:transketolase
MTIVEMQQKVKALKKQGFEMVIKAGKGHLGGSFSCAEFLVALYYGGILKFDSKNPSWEERDYFILSKGHANNVFYPLLADLGYFSQSVIEEYNQNGSLLGGHCEPHIPGVEIVTGSLGHGLGVVAGMALASQLDGKKNHFYVMIGDGESQEGSTWEALMFVAQHKLTNLTVVMDYNMLGSEDYIANTSNLSHMTSRLTSFGFDAVSCDGNDMEDILLCLQERIQEGFPKAIVLHTLKGKGLVTVENQPKSHHTLPKGADVDACRRSLENEYR